MLTTVHNAWPLAGRALILSMLDNHWWEVGAFLLAAPLQGTYGCVRRRRVGPLPLTERLCALLFATALVGAGEMLVRTGIRRGRGRALRWVGVVVRLPGEPVSASRRGTVDQAAGLAASQLVRDVNGRGRYFDANGVAISMRAWARLTQDESYKVLARERVGDFEVITAWFSRDQGDWDGPPLIFGTIARSLSTNAFLEEQEVFAATAAKALTNHATLVENLRGA